MPSGSRGRNTSPTCLVRRWRSHYFGRQLHKLNRQERVSDENFAMAAQVLLDKWAARGCDPKVLTKIRKDVFDIDVPSS